MRTKIYFTIRELTVRSALSELFAISSLDDEIIEPRLAFPDPWEHRDNLGNSWLQEHFLGRIDHHGNVSALRAEPGYSIAWNQLMPWNPLGWRWDYAVHVRGDSRWANWYVEALHWACTRGTTSPPDNVTIDGVDSTWITSIIIILSVTLCIAVLRTLPGRLQLGSCCCKARECADR